MVIACIRQCTDIVSTRKALRRETVSQLWLHVWHCLTNDQPKDTFPCITKWCLFSDNKITLHSADIFIMQNVISHVKKIEFNTFQSFTFYDTMEINAWIMIWDKCTGTDCSSDAHNSCCWIKQEKSFDNLYTWIIQYFKVFSGAIDMQLFEL